MAESHVVSALVAKRHEISGVIARTERQLTNFRRSIHLNARLKSSLRPWSPTFRQQIQQDDLRFEQGELPRRVLNALRRAGEPIRAPDLDGVTGRGRASKPLARFGAMEWRAH